GPSVTPGLSGARLDRLDATLAITREEHVHPLPGDAVTTSRLAWSQRTVDDRKDDDPRLGHATASTMSRLIGQEPSVADVSTHASTMSRNQTPSAPPKNRREGRRSERGAALVWSGAWLRRRATWPRPVGHSPAPPSLRWAARHPLPPPPPPPPPRRRARSPSGPRVPLPRTSPPPARPCSAFSLRVAPRSSRS